MLSDDKVDAILCVAGGWAGGNAASPGIYIIYRHTYRGIYYRVG